MIAVPELVLLLAAASVGVYLGLQYLRGRRNRPVLIGVHLLLGAGALEVMVIVLRGAPSGATVKPGPFGLAAAAMTALAMASGLTAGLIARRSRRTADVTLATHAGLATLAVALFLAWFLKA